MTAFAPARPTILIEACACAPPPGLPLDEDPLRELLEPGLDKEDWLGFLALRCATDGLLEPQAASASSAKPMSGKAIRRRVDRTSISLLACG